MSGAAAELWGRLGAAVWSAQERAADSAWGVALHATAVREGGARTQIGTVAQCSTITIGPPQVDLAVAASLGAHAAAIGSIASRKRYACTLMGSPNIHPACVIAERVS